MSEYIIMNNTKIFRSELFLSSSFEYDMYGYFDLRT
jgi:hypothetical protein